MVRGAKALACCAAARHASEIFDIAPEILRHRLILTYDALARDISIENVLKRILSTVPTMWVSPKPNDIVPRA
jgi:MoxR-like ATPase